MASRFWQSPDTAGREIAARRQVASCAGQFIDSSRQYSISASVAFRRVGLERVRISGPLEERFPSGRDGKPHVGSQSLRAAQDRRKGHRLVPTSVGPSSGQQGFARLPLGS